MSDAPTPQSRRNVRLHLGLLAAISLGLLLGIVTIGGVSWIKMQRSYELRDAVDQLALQIQNARIDEKAYLRLYESRYQEEHRQHLADANEQYARLLRLAPGDRTIYPFDEALARDGQIFDSLSQDAAKLYANVSLTVAATEADVRGLTSAIQTHESYLQMEGERLSADEEGLLTSGRDCRLFVLQLQFDLAQYLRDRNEDHLAAADKLTLGEGANTVSAIVQFAAATHNPDYLDRAKRISDQINAFVVLTTQARQGGRVETRRVAELDAIGNDIAAKAATVLHQAEQAGLRSKHVATILVFGLSLASVLVFIGSNLVISRSISGLVGQLQVSNGALADEVATRKHAEQQLLVAHDQLERRVEERTTDLTAANLSLCHVEASLRQAMEAANAANQAKSEFLANMSHEIRTPMMAIIGYANELLEPGQSADERSGCVNVIRRNGEHLLALINDILDLSKIEAGKMNLESIACSPCQILSEVASLMRIRATEKQLRFDVHVEGSIPKTIKSDPIRLRQVLINLIGNAIKFTERGSVRLIVRLLEGPAQGPRQLQYEVIDTGIGLSQAHIAGLFEPFNQADNSTTRRFGGSGLGLIISKHFAEKLGGGITVRSVLGQGSTFTLTVETGLLDKVPLVKCWAEGMVPETGVTAASVIQVRGRVLLAEDGKDNQRLLAAYLRRAGADVTVADNGRIACEEMSAAAASGAAFDLVLMDMQMPELDGYGATAKLRSDGFATPIVALTAHAMAADREKCLRAGCTDYLSKPVKRDDLLAMVVKHLNLNQAKFSAKFWVGYR